MLTCRPLYKLANRKNMDLKEIKFGYFMKNVPILSKHQQMKQFLDKKEAFFKRLHEIFQNVVDLGTNFDYHTSQAAVDLLTDEEINQNNLPELLFHSLNNKVKPCKSYSFDNQALPFDSPSFLFLLHLNISSLQAHFDELNEFLLDLPNSPAIIFVSETRINIAPQISNVLPGCTFIHHPSPTRAGGIGAYIKSSLIFSIKDNFSLNVQGCEDLWTSTKFPGLKSNYVFCRNLSSPLQ